jgi:hypothetical protein
MAPSHLLSGESFNLPLGKRPAFKGWSLFKPGSDDTNKLNFSLTNQLNQFSQLLHPLQQVQILQVLSLQRALTLLLAQH